ncbi:MAG: glycoside hydrolase family 16 protein [Anaerolineae bacterium]|nr:glycoside hydrolase family 16 protein [Anaerolineae bacterium]
MRLDLVLLLLLEALMVACSAAPTPTLAPTSTPEPPPTPQPTPYVTAGGEWSLVWGDEFDVPGLPDMARWDYEVGYVRNDESQYYTLRRPENARVEDGMLIIEARKEAYKNYDYTSASLITRGSGEWTYGRIEVRAKLPTGKGMWPAIWMLGTNIDTVGWPACGEIDIMENVGFEPNRVYGNIHTTAYNHVKKTNKGASLIVSRPYDEFHVYAIEWFEDRIDFFVDDRRYFTFENESAGSDVWPYDRPQYLILNIAVGGSWGGMQGIDELIFPQQMQIDYVRVYERAN